MSKVSIFNKSIKMWDNNKNVSIRSFSVYIPFISLFLYGISINLNICKIMSQVVTIDLDTLIFCFAKLPSKVLMASIATAIESKWQHYKSNNIECQLRNNLIASLF